MPGEAAEDLLAILLQIKRACNLPESADLDAAFASAPRIGTVSAVKFQSTLVSYFPRIHWTEENVRSPPVGHPPARLFPVLDRNGHPLHAHTVLLDHESVRSCTRFWWPMAVGTAQTLCSKVMRLLRMTRQLKSHGPTSSLTSSMCHPMTILSCHQIGVKHWRCVSGGGAPLAAAKCNFCSISLACARVRFLGALQHFVWIQG
jgi:hypothetical protein